MNFQESLPETASRDGQNDIVGDSHKGNPTGFLKDEL